MAEMADGQYEASLAKNVTVLNNFPHSIADQALFQMGLLYAHPENPNQNYQKSLGAFNKILNEYSQSRLRHQAQLWVLTVQDAIDKKQKIGNLNKKKVSLANTIEQQKIEIALLQKKIVTRKDDDVIDSLEKKVDEQEKKVDEQKKEITQLLEQIEKLKRVDLGIEEKKQKILQQNEIIEEKINGENSGS
jgi:chromosome segregation ATPase